MTPINELAKMIYNVPERQGIDRDTDASSW